MKMWKISEIREIQLGKAGPGACSALLSLALSLSLCLSLKLTYSQPLKNGAWETILSFLGQFRPIFQDYVILVVLGSVVYV